MDSQKSNTAVETPCVKASSTHHNRSEYVLHVGHDGAVGLQRLAPGGDALLLYGGQHIVDVWRQLDAPHWPNRPSVVWNPVVRRLQVVGDVKARVVWHVGWVHIVGMFIFLS